ncbi:MAG TPA: 1,2-phenylacetyl-CoA epoxidase subunit PaaD [Candidatus Limnocylindrales bacterium]|nr:1,2-phenylacetyl-CoA epoxidase subunit PaaD [Candidatus Limnocylindrales bacterium]
MTTATRLDEAMVRTALADVADPEIPSVSIEDLGMVEDVRVADGRVAVTLLPTFVGCPALGLIRSSVEDRLRDIGAPVDVTFSFLVPWSTDRITPAGRGKLQRSGFAPPVADPDETRCPHCGSANVALDNLFGPTQCRSLYYCRTCRQPFEGFKTV